MAASSGLLSFANKYSVAPIVLVGGIASGIPGGMLSIANIINAALFALGATSGASAAPPGLPQVAFTLMPGGRLEDIQVPLYPVANQAFAANAVVVQALRLSLRMTFPAPATGAGYSAKLSMFTSLKGSLDQHIQQGGSFNVSTPAYIYPGMLLEHLTDVSRGGEGDQVQDQWQWDFVQPLLTNAQLAAQANLLMSKIQSGTQISGDPPSSKPAVLAAGQPTSGLAQGSVPAVSNLTGASVSAPSYGSGPNPAASTQTSQAASGA